MCGCSIIRRWKCLLNPCNNTAASRRDLQKKELALDQKEKELLKKERLLKHKIKKYKKHSSRKAKTNLRAANKLNRARKKLLLVLDSKDQLKKRKKCGKGKAETNGNNCFIHALTENSLQCFNDLFNKPCYCNPRRRRVRNVEPSLLRSICGGPCRCPPSSGRQYVNRKMLGFRTCRCESQARNRYGAGDCYLMTLRQTPQVWIHQRWPRLYPHYLDARHQWKNFSYCMLFCAGILIWTPCILCLELCKCFCCACCSE